MNNNTNSVEMMQNNVSLLQQSPSISSKGNRQQTIDK